MKICPRCQKTYSDDALNFCLEDGSVLTQAQSQQPPPTVFINPPQSTQPQPYNPSQPGSQPAWGVNPQPYATPPKKSSKTWIWVLLILGALILLCGGGLIGFLAYVGSQAEKAANTLTNTGSNRPPLINSNRSTSNSSSNSNSAISDRDDVTKVDLALWTEDSTPYGTTIFDEGELKIAAKSKGYYYAVNAPAGLVTTDDADTKVTVRNLDNAASRMGYGLVFHSNPLPLQQDYAFLIDTKAKKYRLVNHTPQKENIVLNWTSSPAIKGGTDENTLEIRDLTDSIELYINGTKVNSVKNVYGYANGVPGLYSGDGVNIAFKDLEIRK